MGIRDEIGRSLAAKQHFLENRPVLLGGVDHAGTGLIEPALYTGKGLFQGEGMIIDAGIGADPGCYPHSAPGAGPSCGGGYDTVGSWLAIRSSVIRLEVPH